MMHLLWLSLKNDRILEQGTEKTMTMTPLESVRVVRTSLVVQWLRLCLPMPRMWVQSLLLLLSRFSHVLCDSVRPQRQQPNSLPRPWDSPGKNTGVGCHFLLQCMKVKSESEVTQSCLTLSDPMDCSPPGSSVHGIFQARVLEWVAIAFSNLFDIYFG